MGGGGGGTSVPAQAFIVSALICGVLVSDVSQGAYSAALREKYWAKVGAGARFSHPEKMLAQPE